MFCYFLGNGDGLHLAGSADGLAFTAIGGAGKIFLVPTVGVNPDGTTKDNHLMRDPCIRQGADGMYHLVWTTGWYQQGFGVASSPDLTHWSEQQFVEVWKNEPKAVNTWAPELFFDDQKNQWMVFWATTMPGKFSETEPKAEGDRTTINGVNVGLNHRIYYTTTKDFKTWAEAKLLYDPGFICIDATIAKRPDGKYMMVLKDETKVPVAQKNLHMAVAESPEGPWGKASASISPAGLWVEGPTVNRVNDAWYVFYDAYTTRKYGAIKTVDFEKWEEVPGAFSVPMGSRHGTVFAVEAGVVERLRGENAG